jgi:UDP-N-acetyl-D-mannosaminuronate dehydrogenase
MKISEAMHKYLESDTCKKISIEMYKKYISELPMTKTSMGAFIHDSEEDTLEMDIRIVLNVRHSEYGKLYTALSKMIKNAQKKPDLVRMTSGL